MASTRQRPSEAEPSPDHDGSVGALVSAVAADAQTLLRQEVELARAEVRQEASSVGKAAGMFGAAGFSSVMIAVFASVTAVAALDHVLDTTFAGLIVTGVWAVIGTVSFVLARSRMRSVPVKPEHTMETLKEDARWARHPSR